MVSQYYVCERCGSVARVVHHRKYISPQNINDVDTTLNWSNLEALCYDCHNTEHCAVSACAEGLRFDSSGNLIKI
ncbi:MAG: HNH endonuclease [Peptococcaceae bacterium]|nr:HNH endonuclease [Peptococcaceae bacterium]